LRSRRRGSMATSSAPTRGSTCPTPNCTCRP
jgi:hypothetical protein